MRIATYYMIILVIATIFYLVAERSKEHKKKFIGYLCYFGIFLEVLLLV